MLLIKPTTSPSPQILPYPHHCFPSQISIFFSNPSEYCVCVHRPVVPRGCSFPALVPYLPFFQSSHPLSSMMIPEP